ncbi:MAG: SufD family Fe-S cluster assembly protein [Bacilli bacterium]|nr:SufD family Fe-S cluster assembly protein [Bacilli bacterium]
MKVNSTPKRTSNNFRINDFEIDDKLFNVKLNEFNNFTLENIKIKKIKKIINNKYGVEKTNQINNGNFKYNIEIIDNSKYGIINFDLDKDLVDLIEINIDKDANFLINYRSKNNYYHNGLIKVNVNDNVKANIIVVNNLSNDSINLLSFDNVCNNYSILNYLIIDIGAKTSISNYYSSLIGDSSKNNLNSIYIGEKKQVFDINYLVDVFGKNSKCNIDVQGSLNNESKKNFKGTINFNKGSSKSIGEENEYCVLLSDKVISKSMPMLLCTEDDVIGNHSTASGKVNEKVLFYIMSRGISKKNAEKLIVKSNFNKLLNMIKDDNIRNEIEELIDKKL